MPNAAGCLRGVSGHDSKIRVAVTKADELKWIFPQEKATFHNARMGILNLILHYTIHPPPTTSSPS